MKLSIRKIILNLSPLIEKSEIFSIISMALIVLKAQNTNSLANSNE